MRYQNICVKRSSLCPCCGLEDRKPAVWGKCYITCWLSFLVFFSGMLVSVCEMDINWWHNQKKSILFCIGSGLSSASKYLARMVQGIGMYFSFSFNSHSLRDGVDIGESGLVFI